MHEEFHAELIQRFLTELDISLRLALGNSQIKVCLASGDEKTVALAEEFSFVLSPKIPILHVQAESKGHYYALELLKIRYIQAAGRVGFTYFSLCDTSIVGSASLCKKDE